MSVLPNDWWGWLKSHLVKGPIEQVALLITVAEGQVGPTGGPLTLTLSLKSRVHFVQLGPNVTDLKLIESQFGTIVVVVVVRCGRSLAARARSKGKSVVGGFSLRRPRPVLTIICLGSKVKRWWWQLPGPGWSRPLRHFLDPSFLFWRCWSQTGRVLCKMVRCVMCFEHALVKGEGVVLKS